MYLTRYLRPIKYLLVLTGFALVALGYLIPGDTAPDREYLRHPEREQKS